MTIVAAAIVFSMVAVGGGNNRPTPPKWYQGENGRIYRTNGVPEHYQDSTSWNSYRAREIRSMLYGGKTYGADRRYGREHSVAPHGGRWYRCRKCGAVNYLDGCGE